MILSRELANEIVHRSMSIIFHNVNVMSPDGVIIASGDSKRIGSIHAVGLRAAKEKKKIKVYPNEANLFKSVAPGINQPIIINGEVQFVVGVSGNPEEISRYAELAFLTAELLTKQQINNEYINWHSRLKDLEFIALLQSNPEDWKINNESFKFIEKSLKLPKFLYILDIYSDNALKHKNIMLNIVSKLNMMAEDIDTIVITPLTIIIMSKQIDNLEIGLKQVKDICIHQGLGLKVVKAPSNEYRMNSLVSVLAFLRIAINNLKAIKLNDSKYIDIELNYNDILIDSLSSAINHKIYNKYILSMLHNYDQDQKLAYTIKAYVRSNLEAVKTANELHIHRNTMKNRFNLIKRITGLNPALFKDLIILYLAVKNEPDHIGNTLPPPIFSMHQRMYNTNINLLI